MSLVVGAAVPVSPNEGLALTPTTKSVAAPAAAPVVSRQTDKEPSVELRTQTNTTKNQVSQTERRTDTTVQSSKAADETRVDKALDALAREASAENSVRDLLNAQQQGKGDERARLLMNILRTDTSANLRRIAAWGLSDHADKPGVAAALAEALRKDSNASVREMAAWALGEGEDDKDAVAALVAAIKSDADDKVKSTALWALGQTGSHESTAIDVMTDALRSREAKVRETALWAIGNMEPEKAPREVLTALGDSSSHVRLLATWVLFNVADESAVPALETALDREKDSDVRRGIVRALAATGEKSTDALSKLLGSSDPEIRSLAVKSLAGSHGAGPWPWPWPKPRPFP
jgi:HEAT repeat protein